MDDYMFGEKPKWKDDYWRKVAHAGYAEVSYEDVWSLDTRLALMLLKNTSGVSVETTLTCFP